MTQAVVTAVRARGRGRVEVDLDGRAWRVVAAEAAVVAGLRPGVTLDRPRARTLARSLREIRARETALRALSRRDVSAAGVRERLARAGVPPAAAEATGEALARAGLVDDERLARSRAAALAARGWGNAAILADLDRRGISAETAAAAVEALAPERERAAAALSKPGAGLREARALVGRGFDPELVAELVEDVVARRPTEV